MSHLSASVPVALRFVERTAREIASRSFIGRAAGVRDAKTLASLKTALSTEAEHMVFDVADPRALVKRCVSELRATRFGKRGIFLIETGHGCGSAWKKDPDSGVIGVEKGPLIPVV